MKRMILGTVVLINLLLITSCSKKEIIEIDLSDQIVSITQLLDKTLEIEYEKAVVKPIIFTNKEQFEKFTKQYFINYVKSYGIEDFEYQKYDLLLVNVKKINPKGDTLYSIDSISKYGDNVEITLKTDSKVASKESSKDAIIENVIYLKLDKGIISPESNFEVKKK